MLWLAHQQVKSKSARIRRQAVLKLRDGLPSAVVPVFAKVLQEDGDPAVRAAAADALGDHKGDVALNALMSALTDASGLVRTAAVEGLHRMGDAGAVPALVPLLQNAEASLRARVAQALKLLGWRPPDAQHEALFLVALGELDRAAILGRAAVGALAEVLKDPAYQRRVVAVNRLAEIGDETAVAPLLKALHDTDALVRSAAARALGRVGATRAAASILALLRDTDTNVRVAAAEASGLIGDAQATQPLVGAAGDSHWEVRGAALEALGRLQARDAIQTLAGGLRDEDRDVREMAAEALGRLGDPRAIGPLAVAMLDLEAPVRHAVGRALQQIDPYWFQSPGLEDVDEALREGLKHPDYAVKQAAADVLRRAGRLAGGRERPTATTVASRRHSVREILLELLSDGDPAIRQAGVECLVRGHEPVPEDRRDALLLDADLSVRQAAMAGLGGSPS